MTEKLAAQLVQIIQESLIKFDPITESQWSEKPVAEKWSKKEILGHLADSAFTNIQRFVRIQHADQTNLYYDQNFWVKANDYQHQDIAAIQSLWQTLNLQIARVWKNTSADDLQKTIPVNEETPTLQFFMEDYIVHMSHHLRQII